MQDWIVALIGVGGTLGGTGLGYRGARAINRDDREAADHGNPELYAMSTQPAVALDVLHIGDVAASRAWVFRPRSKPVLAGVREVLWPRGNVVALPLLAFVVRHPDQGTLVVDTGLHRQAIEDLRSDYGLVNGLFFRSLRPTGGSFDEQLRAHGVDPDEVRLVVMTHLHADHTSGIRLLPNAQFVCARA